MKKSKRKTNKRQQQDRQTIALKPKLLTLAIAQALAFQTVDAATIEVTSNLDDGTDCTLREAVESVNVADVGMSECSYSGTFGNNDTITFAPGVSGSTITLAGSQIEIEKSVSINPGGSDTTISGNDLSRVIFSNTAGITIELDHLKITKGNAVGSLGGGVYVVNNTLNMLNSTISNSTAGTFGGGLEAIFSSVTLTNSTVSGNSAGIDAGGLAIFDSIVTLMDSTVSDNSASTFGGGLRIVQDSSVTMTNLTISGNSAGIDGGGINLRESSASITNSSISGNSAGHGGGVYSYRGSSISLSNTTISGNSADFGGAIKLYDSTASLTDNTISGNTAGNDGGGLYLYRSTALLSNSTMSNNTAPSGSGVVLYRNANNPVSTLTLENSIIANGVGGGQDCERTGNVLGHNFIMGADNIVEDNGCFGTPQTIDPGLLPLAANGGPTETHALMPGSPAIDGGNNATCEATDQRGEARNDGACDIGAYEFKVSVMSIAKKDRKMNSLMSNGEQWYSFNSTESQKLSMQTNGFDGDTMIELYQGSTPKQINPLLKMDDDSGPDLFSNIKHNVNNGPYLIRVKGETDVDPYWLRLMSDKDILSFNDTNTHFADKEIRVMSSAGITGGCGTGIYCPTSPVTRAQMAIFMLKAILGGNHSSPPASGTVFSDVSTSSFGASFIEEFSTLGITSGCGGGKYCPDLAVTREQMAVFLLRAWYGSSYTPPAATPAEINQFSDIANSFAKDWIVQLTKENITGGCGGGKFCPTDTVTRGQMAAFIARTFDLDVSL